MINGAHVIVYSKDAEADRDFTGDWQVQGGHIHRDEDGEPSGILIDKANAAQKPVFVATNLLETMVVKERPTRAEIQDVISTVVGGAAGLTLAAETAIGKQPYQGLKRRILGEAPKILLDYTLSGAKRVLTGL